MAKKKSSKKSGSRTQTPRTTSGTASVDQPSRAGRRFWLTALVLLAVTFLAYRPALEGDFIAFDDTVYVSQNDIVQRGLTADGVAWAFSSFHASNYHPLTWLSHMLDIEIWGLDASGHHLTNVLLHLASALVLLWLLLRLTAAWWPSTLVALLFALHPTHVESVAWVAERKDVLSTLFWMVTLLAYVRWTEKPGARHYAFLVTSFVLGLLAKPMLVTLPFVLLLLDVWPLGRLRIERWTEFKELLPRVLEKGPLFALTLVSSIVTVLAQQAGGAVVAVDRVGLGERIANAAVTYVAYLGKLLWPSNLSLFYPHPGMPPAWQIAGALVLLVAVTVLALRLRTSRPYLIVGWLWYLGTLVPVIGLVQVGAQAMADRYTYVPFIGLTLALAWGLADLPTRWAATRVDGKAGEDAATREPGLPSWLRWTGVVTALVLTVVLAWLTHRQAMHWRNSETIFTHSLAVTEGNYLMHNNLGAELLDQGRYGEAIGHLETALELRPLYTQAHNNLGLVLSRRGEASRAEHHFRRTLEIDSGFAEAYLNLGNLYAAQGRPNEAVTEFRAALRADSRLAEAHNNLANTLASQGRLDEALEAYEAALALRPNYANAHANLANVLVQAGRLEEAEARYRRALELDSRHVEAHVNLATVLADRGDLQGALRYLKEATRLEPQRPEPHFFLALGYLQSGDRQAAEAQIELLRRIDPAMAQQLLRELGATPR